MVRVLITLLFLLLATFPAKAFDCAPTAALIAELAKIQPPPSIQRLDPQLHSSFISGMQEMGNVTSLLPAGEVTDIILVSAQGAENLVVMLERNGAICGAVRLNRNMALDIIRRGADA